MSDLAAKRVLVTDSLQDVGVETLCDEGLRVGGSARSGWPLSRRPPFLSAPWPNRLLTGLPGA